MKTKILFSLLLIVCFTYKGYSQITFSVSPGIGLNTAQLGYKVNEKFIPFIGFQYVHAGVNTEFNGEEFDFDLGEIVSYSETYKLSGTLYIPNIGAKYFFTQKDKLKAYTSLCLSKPILSAKMIDDGDVDEDFKETVKNISLFGGELGVGVEYFFDEHFSIGGEFGLRYIHAKYKDSYEDEIYDPEIGDYRPTEVENIMKFNLNPTYTKVSLNFYF
jgi:hypothetical protein